MRVVCAILLLCPSIVSAQVTGIVWDRSPDPTVTGYLVRVDGTQIALTTALTVPWTPAAAYHRLCVSSQAGTLTGAPNCIDYGIPPVVQPPLPPPPVPVPSACTEVQSGTDALGHVWTIGDGWTLRDGAYSLPGGGNLPGANGTAYVFVAGVVHVKDSRDSLWYRWNELAKNWVLVGATVPACTAPPPTPPPPTPTPPPPVPASPPPVVVPTTCKISVANKPDARTGWGVQFTRDGVNIGGRDTGAPYERSVAYQPGTHVWQAIWTKTGVPSITSAVTTQGCQ